MTAGTFSLLQKFFQICLFSLTTLIIDSLPVMNDNDKIDQEVYLSRTVNAANKNSSCGGGNDVNNESVKSS